MEITTSQAQLTEWAEICLRINHLNTLVQREVKLGNLERAGHLSERARRRAWNLSNEMLRNSAQKPPGYREPFESPKKPTTQSPDQTLSRLGYPPQLAVKTPPADPSPPYPVPPCQPARLYTPFP